MATLAQALRNALVAEKICLVDRSEVKTIQSPYGSQPSTTVQAIAGTYAPAAYTNTNDALSVDDEFIVAEHIFDFEATLTAFDIFASRVDEMTYSVAAKIDRFVLNNLCEDGTGAYSTPAGGFSAANISVIASQLLSKVAGFAEQYNGLFLVIEAQDIPGFVQAQATNGFSFADMALNNGFMSRYMGIEIYVVANSTFADETLGTKTYTNSGHRVFGVKNVATYAAPRGVQFDEKGVTGKTGKEVVVWGYIGFKLWTPKASLVVDITVTP